LATSFCWLHVGKASSVESTHTPEYTREQAEDYGKALLSDWICSVPRPKNEAPDTLEKQLEGAEYFRNKMKGDKNG